MHTAYKIRLVFTLTTNNLLNSLNNLSVQCIVNSFYCHALTIFVSPIRHCLSPSSWEYEALPEGFKNDGLGKIWETNSVYYGGFEIR